MKAKIMIVDDEEHVRQSLEEILRLEGYETLAVDNGDDAIEHLKAESFDLLLLDLKMPGVDGLDVLRAASKLASDIKVILLTGHGSLESAIEALRFGAYDYILKPAPTRDLLNSISRALAQKAGQQQRRLLLEQLDASVQRLKIAEGLESFPAIEQQVYVLEDNVTIDLERREVWQGNQRVSLTPTEGKLMKVLLENRGRVMTHRELVLKVQGYDTTDWEAPEVLRPLVSRLRRKLSEFPNSGNWIVNVRGTGYVFESTGSTQSA